MRSMLALNLGSARQNVLRNVGRCCSDWPANWLASFARNRLVSRIKRKRVVLYARALRAGSTSFE